MGHLKTLVLGSLLLLPAAAGAENNDPITEAPVTRAPYGSLALTPRAGGIVFARQIVESPPPTTGGGSGGTQALAASLYIYLNKNGATLTQGGVNNSGNNVSTIVNGTRTLPAWNVDATTWNTVVTSVREMFAPFGVIVSDQPPAGGVRHIEAMFGGTAGDVLAPDQLPPQGVILGVSPFTPNCDVIEDSIVFTFAASAVQVGQTPRQIAEIAAQEIAHSFGLDHVLNASDPMTYLDYTGNRSFKAGAVSCGEYSQRQCGLVQQGFPACRATQDDVALLTERIGTGGNPGDTIPPSVAITAPSNNAMVPPEFDIYINASDNTAVASVDIYIDDQLVGTVASPPYTFRAPPTVTLGDHLVRVVASDGVQAAEQTINVTVDEDADPVQPPGGDNGDDEEGGVTGGCAAAGGQGGIALLVGLAFAGLVRRRRR